MAQEILAIKGIFASDIDGTIAFKGKEIAQEFFDCFERLAQSGWLLLFSTGRTFSWACRHLNPCVEPYYIAPFNGAALWKREAGAWISLYDEVLDRAAIESFMPLLSQHGGIAYESFPGERICLFQSGMPQEILAHVRMRQQFQKEVWIDADREGGIEGSIPADFVSASSIRLFCAASDRSFAERVIRESRSLGLSAVQMKDSFSSKMQIIQITAQDATKGRPLKWLRERYGAVPVVAIGDDLNDISMFQEAARSIGIAGSDPEVLSHVDCVTRTVEPIEIVRTIMSTVEAL